MRSPLRNSPAAHTAYLNLAKPNPLGVSHCPESRKGGLSPRDQHPATIRSVSWQEREWSRLAGASPEGATTPLKVWGGTGHLPLSPATCVLSPAPPPPSDTACVPEDDLLLPCPPPGHPLCPSRLALPHGNSTPSRKPQVARDSPSELSDVSVAQPGATPGWGVW